MSIFARFFIIINLYFVLSKRKCQFYLLNSKDYSGTNMRSMKTLHQILNIQAQICVEISSIKYVATARFGWT